MPMKDDATPSQVLFAGVASLLVELTVIRYLPGQIRVLGYFTNFVLLAAFVGLGVGMLGARSSLARTGDADRALASNLVGAVAGGLVEYLSTMLGFRMLVVVAALFYALAIATTKRSGDTSPATV
jgi:hypothetical protein